MSHLTLPMELNCDFCNINISKTTYSTAINLIELNITLFKLFFITLWGLYEHVWVNRGKNIPIENDGNAYDPPPMFDESTLNIKRHRIGQ